MQPVESELPKEIARVRDEVLPVYGEIGLPGVLASALMRADLNDASKAMVEGDTVTMIHYYFKLKGWKV